MTAADPTSSNMAGECLDNVSHDCELRKHAIILYSCPTAVHLLPTFIIIQKRKDISILLDVRILRKRSRKVLLNTFLYFFIQAFLFAFFVLLMDSRNTAECCEAFTESSLSNLESIASATN